MEDFVDAMFCWWQPAHLDYGEDAGVLRNSVIYTVSTSFLDAPLNLPRSMDISLPLCQLSNNQVKKVNVVLWSADGFLGSQPESDVSHAHKRTPSSSCQYSLPGPWLTFQLQSVTTLWMVLINTAWWTEAYGWEQLAQSCYTAVLQIKYTVPMIASPTPYCCASTPPIINVQRRWK